MFTNCELSWRMLTSVDAVVEALGGTTAAAGLLGITPSAVSNWKDRGGIPPDKFLAVSEALERKSLRVDLGVFRFKETV